MLGRHLLVDLELDDCCVKLNDPVFLETMLEDAADHIGAQVIDTLFHQFSPQGVSGVVVIAESHISIHTWPESGTAALDIFTCGNIDPWEAVAYIAKKLNVDRLKVYQVVRGI